MGIRPSKHIGWGVKAEGSQLNKSAMENLFEPHKKSNNKLSYSNFLNFVKEHELLTKFDGTTFLDSSRYEEADKQDAIYQFAEEIPLKFDSSAPFTEQEFIILFYPSILTPISSRFSKKEKFDSMVKDFYELDSAFVYAEIENFFPESFKNLETVSYNFKTPPFPSEYSIIETGDLKTISDWNEYSDKSTMNDVRRALYAKEDDKYADVYATLTGFENLDELKRAYRFGPPEDVFAFAQYVGLFKDGSLPFQLEPTVAYCWG